MAKDVIVRKRIIWLAIRGKAGKAPGVGEARASDDPPAWCMDIMHDLSSIYGCCHGRCGSKTRDPLASSFK